MDDDLIDSVDEKSDEKSTTPSIISDISISVSRKVKKLPKRKDKVYLSNSFRQKIKTSLGEKTEVALFNFTVRELKRRDIQPKLNEEFKEFYTKTAYELFASKEDHLTLLRENKLGFDSPEFNDLYIDFQNEEKLIVSPFEVEEGIHECNKCKSKKTFSYQLQTRGGDEGITTYVQCICGNRWKFC